MEGDKKAAGGDGGGEECFKGSCKNKIRHAAGGSSKLPDPDIASLQAWATKVFDTPDMQAQADAATIESPASLTQARQLISFIKKHCKSLDNGVLAIFEHFTAADFEASGGTRFHWVKVLTSSSVKEWNSLTTLGLLWLKDKRICKGHFKPEDLHENGQVKVGALPTVGTAAVSVTAPVTATPTREPPRTGLSSAERQDRKRTLDTRRFDDYIGGATESLEEVLGELNTSIRAIQALPGESPAYSSTTVLAP